jgi:hypothetical protein
MFVTAMQLSMSTVFGSQQRKQREQWTQRKKKGKYHDRMHNEQHQLPLDICCMLHI